MKKAAGHTISSHHNEYEEIANIPEAIADGFDINGEECFEDESVVEIDLKDFEEIGEVDMQSLKSMTIIDEFEKNTVNDLSIAENRNSTDLRNSVNIQKLSLQVDSLTSIKKRHNVKQQTEQVFLQEKPKRKASAPELQKITEQKKVEPGLREEEEKKEDVPIVEQRFISKKSTQEFEIQHDDLDDIEQLQKEIVEQAFIADEFESEEPPAEKSEKKLEESPEEICEEKSKNENIITDDIQDTILKQYEEIEKEYRDDSGKYDIFEKKKDELPRVLKFEFPEEKNPEYTQDPPETIRGNVFTIEIPDRLLNEFPEDFNMDELGTIDLVEAETIAEEDILSLTKGEIQEELEGLDILPENDKVISAKNEVPRIPPPEKKKEEVKIELKEKEIKKEPEKTDIKKEANDKKESDVLKTPLQDEKIITPEEQFLPVEDESKTIVKKEKEVINTKDQNSVPKPVIKQEGPGLQVDLSEEIKDERVFILDSENINSEIISIYSQTDDLENISSSAADSIKGEAKQLSESETADRKAVTGLIRDNYPAFKDLLKEKEAEEQHTHFDDDIAFVNDSFINYNQADKFVQFRNPPEDVIQSKASPYEQILGLVPDEIDLIEDQLFKIQSRKIDADKTISEIFYDQPPEDTIELERYKYILPVANSLLDDEKKSIENEILAKSALIFEEDVDKIKEKLEGSMEKKIKETIQDITGKITIYEENKNHNKTDKIESEKEDIKKLLNYLNGLLENLPEQSINKFAESDYYELYKKVLKDLDI
jgi:pilus assembly protein FimV